MPLEFVGKAISLSGLTGTKLKCDVIGAYYPFWWKITSGGSRRNHPYSTAIVELDAATGEVHIKDTGETVLGSAGHALKLKAENASITQNLKVVLVEKHRGCYDLLKEVIEQKWPSVSVNESEGPVDSNSSGFFLLNKTLDEALDAIKTLRLGNALFFFDPLRNVEYTAIESVANSRMNNFYKSGTEFMIFVFTSDWFLGRDELEPLPCTCEESTWSAKERGTVSEADSLFGDKEWRTRVLDAGPVADRESALIELYRYRLHKWFRYVLPMPFKPKEGQIFHLILCSNYWVGVRATKDFYCKFSRNPKYSPDNASAFNRFRKLYPDVFRGFKGTRKPLHWRVLWRVIRNHEEGICDHECKSLKEIVPDTLARDNVLNWLEKNGYLVPFEVENAWQAQIRQYKLNWSIVLENLGVSPPPQLVPLSQESI